MKPGGVLRIVRKWNKASPDIKTKPLVLVTVSDRADVG